MENKKFRVLSREILANGLLSRSQEIELGENILSNSAKAKESKDKLVLSNLRLVIAIASDYENLGDIQDLVSEGIIGLNKAAEKYDPRFNVKFSSYSSFWIRQHIIKAIKSERLIRVPEYSYRKYLQIMKFRDTYKDRHGEYPVVELLSKKFKSSIEQIKNLLNLKEQIVSLNAKVDEESATELIDVIEDSSGEDSSRSTIRNESGEMLTKLLKVLNEKEKLVIESRFGLKNKNEETLHEIGVRLNLTRERVRQIESSAIEKMKEAANKIK